MPGPIAITYVNNSKTALQKSNSYTGYATQLGVSSLSTSPSDTLAANGGTTTIEIDENALSNLATGDMWMSLGWANPNTNYHFGVKIIMPFQMLGMGDRPYYQASATSGSGPQWADVVDDPSDSYTFPKVDFHIGCTPHSTHTSLTVTVTITD